MLSGPGCISCDANLQAVADPKPHRMLLHRAEYDLTHPSKDMSIYTASSRELWSLDLNSQHRNRLGIRVGQYRRR
jgi:hypothetical protein